MIFFPGNKSVSFFKQNSSLHSHKNKKEEGEAECILYYEP